MIEKDSFSYYENKNIINGILLDMHDAILTTNRSIYSISDWLGEVGGFASSVQLIIMILLPFLRNAELESYLIGKLFK